MKYYIFSLILMGFISIANGQNNYHSVENLVPNPSFEVVSSGWMMSTGSYIFREPTNVPDNLYGSQSAADGKAYGFLYDYYGFEKDHIAVELIEPLISGVRYQISFQASLIDGNQELDPEKCKFKTNFYDDYNYAQNKPQGDKSDDEDWKVTDETNWKTKYYEFTADDTYTHFVVQLRTQLTNSGVYLDDFKITECAYNSCSQTKGIISANYANYNRFGITNISNVSSIRDIQIYSRNGPLVATEENAYSVNGFKENFYLANHGLAPAYYTAKFTLGNDCFEDKKAVDFLVVGTGNDYYTESRHVYSDIRIPKPECADNINLRSGTLTDDFPVVALKTITTTGDLIIPSTLQDFEFVAGTNIKFKPGLKIENGAEFRAIIDSRRSLKSGGKKSDYTLSDCGSEIEENLLSNNSDEEFSFKLYPNPTNGVFQIQSNANNNEISIEIYNSIGNRILLETSNESNSTIDITSHPKGIYFIYIKDTTGEIVKSKIILQ
ncbi:MAG: T9SS type A sorting domain-containing protein [Salinivirgaceae bacterium]|nr:T9SS type A sorting domain-containing protein [Salinivirgaceae bacterium]